MSEQVSETIKIRPSTKEQLDNMKFLDRESYDQVITRLIEITLEDEMVLRESAQQLIEKRLSGLKRLNADTLSSSEAKEHLVRSRKEDD